MNLFNKVISIINRNVYLTNLLLLPAFLFSLVSIFDMHKWKVEKNHAYYIYITLWYLLSILFFFTICFSNIFHWYMFKETKNLTKKIGKLDYLFTAPLCGIITIALSLLYVFFLKNKALHAHDYKDVFTVALIYIIIGGIFYIIKHILLPKYNRKNFLKKVKYLMAHTFFHYISYAGVSFLILIYHLNNKEIFQYITQKHLI